jgi:hypothetical protein
VWRVRVWWVRCEVKEVWAVINLGGISTREINIVEDA